MKKRIIVLLLSVSTIVGCGKNSENRKIELSENKNSENLELKNKQKEKLIQNIKSETHKKLFSKILEIIKEETKDDYIVEYNTSADAVTFLAIGNEKDKILKYINSKSEEDLKKLNNELKQDDITEIFNTMQFYFLNPEKPDTVAFIYKDRELKRVKEELKIIPEEKINFQENNEILSQDEIKEIQLETKKESLNKFIEMFQEKIGNDVKIEYNKKFDSLIISPSDEAKEGLKYMLNDKNSDENKKVWEKIKKEYISSSKELSEIFEDMPISILYPDKEIILLTIKNGEITEDNFLK